MAANKGIVAAGLGAALCMVVGVVGVLGLSRSAEDGSESGSSAAIESRSVASTVIDNADADLDSKASTPSTQPELLAYVDDEGRTDHEGEALESNSPGGTGPIIPALVDPNTEAVPEALPRTAVEADNEQGDREEGLASGDFTTTTEPEETTTTQARPVDSSTATSTTTSTSAPATTTSTSSTTSTTAPPTTTSSSSTTSTTSTSTTSTTSTTAATTSSTVATTTSSVISTTSTSPPTTAQTASASPTSVLAPRKLTGAETAARLLDALPTVDDLAATTRRTSAPTSGTGQSGGAVALPTVLDTCLDPPARTTIEQDRRSWATVDFTGQLADVGFTLIRYDDPDGAWSAVLELWHDCLGLAFPLVVDIDLVAKEQLIWNATVRERLLPSLDAETYAVQMAGPSVWTGGTQTSLEPIGLVLWVRIDDVIGIVEYSSLGTTAEVIDHAHLLVDAAEQASRSLTKGS